MLVIINPYAAAGNAIKKWHIAKPFFKSNGNSIDFRLINDPDFNDEFIHTAINKGENEFVAAGGDGTINYLLNSIMKYPNPQIFKCIKIGAIGLGSSNDFHKPFKNINDKGIPNKIKFEEAEYRDVGFFRYSIDQEVITKYFLINASLGLTASGNFFFNHPDKVLAKIKRLYPLFAIYYAAFKSILNYQNINAKIICNPEKARETNISNLGIVKSPHFSGELIYNSPIEYDNGFFDLHLSTDLSKVGAFSLLWKLGHHKPLNKLITSWRTKEISISARRDFIVEYDGETILTNSVLFGILNKKIMVCKS